MIKVSVRITPDQLGQIDAYARANRRGSVSDAIRICLQDAGVITASGIGSRASLHRIPPRPHTAPLLTPGEKRKAIAKRRTSAGGKLRRRGKKFHRSA